MSAPPRREEHITATGLRIVGKGARELAAKLAQPGELAPGDDADGLFAARFMVRPRLGAGSAVEPVLAVLGAAVARQYQAEAPPLTRTRPATLPPGRFAGLTWAVEGSPGAWAGELLWRHPHPVVAGSPCTTHLILIEQGSRLALHVRVTSDTRFSGVSGAVAAGQARPQLLSDLNHTVRLSFDGFDATPRVLSERDIDGFVRETLLADDRSYPAAVLSPLEEGGYAVSPEELADELLGLAPLWIIDRHPATFRLSDALGDRRLSAYWGALRTYLPGFSCADRPQDHPLLVRERVVDPVMRAELLGNLGREGIKRLPMPTGPAGMQARPPAPEAARRPPRPAAHEIPAAPPSAELTVAAPAPAPPARDAETARRLGELAGAVDKLVQLTASLLDEMTRLRTTTAVRAGNTIGLERRIGSLERLLERHLTPETAAAPGQGAEVEPAGPGADEAAESEETLTVADMLRQAAESHPSTLLILESAERSAAQSPYQDPDRVGVILDAMADVARRRQDGALGTSLREAFRELGIDYRGGIAASTPDRLRQQYQLAGPGGKIYPCEEHIVLGNSYDPRRCLRIYFTSRASLEARFVIGHVGRHFDVLTTS